MVKAAAANVGLQNEELIDAGGPGYEPSPWDVFDQDEHVSEGTGEEMKENAVAPLETGELRVVSGVSIDTPEPESVTEIHGEIEKLGDTASVEIDATAEVETTTEAEQVDDAGESDEDGDEDEGGDDSDEPTEAESTYMRKLRESEQDYAGACLELAELEDKLASTKEEIKDQREVCKALAGKLRTIKKQGEAQLEIDDIPLLEKERKSKANNHDDPATDSSGQEAASATDEEPKRDASSVRKSKRDARSDETWKSVPIDQLGLDGIKGMGKKKRELIYDECRTLGELEALRAGAGLMSIKGIGRGMADQIEEVILMWLSRNRDAEVLAAAAGGAIEAKDHSEQVAVRAAQIRDDASFEHKDIFQGAFDSGKQAYEDPESDVTDCPWTQGEQQDAWIAGWLHAESLDE